MTIEPISSGRQGSTIADGARAVTGGSTALGYDAFLQLLIAQMQNQDPMEPMKSSDYVAQLATFSQVEKSIAMNDRLAALLSATRITQAEGIIGKSVTSADGAISGVATAARVAGDEVVATLADGREVTLEPGITIGGAPA
jgi:flagellar basal-body rod modification protein FlgD